MKNWLKRSWKGLAWIVAALTFLATAEPWLSAKFPGVAPWFVAVWEGIFQWSTERLEVRRGWVLLLSALVAGMAAALVAIVYRARARKRISVHSLGLNELYVMSALAVKDGQPVTAAEVAQRRRVRNLEIEEALSSLSAKDLVTIGFVIVAGPLRYSLTSAGRAMAISYQIENAIAAKQRPPNAR